MSTEQLQQPKYINLVIGDGFWPRINNILTNNEHVRTALLKAIKHYQDDIQYIKLADKTKLHTGYLDALTVDITTSIDNTETTKLNEFYIGLNGIYCSNIDLSQSGELVESLTFKDLEEIAKLTEDAIGQRPDHLLDVLFDGVLP